MWAAPCTADASCSREFWYTEVKKATTCVGRG